VPALLILLLGCGLFFRFHNLDKKFYWEDEAWTSLVLAGFMAADVRSEVLGADQLTFHALQRFHHVGGNPGIVRVLVAKAADPQHPPLYFVSLWLWAHVFGDSISSLRSFSAVISVFAFPCLYWLCLELFGSPVVGSIAVALLAVSPLHTLFAQEARPYALLTVVILLSSAALLRAVRLGSRPAWILYGATVMAGLYVHTLFIFPLLSHTLYIALRRSDPLRPFWLDDDLRSLFTWALIGVATFLPWMIPIVVALPVVSETMAWMRVPMSMPALAQSMAFNLSSVFVDTYALLSLSRAPSVATRAMATGVTALILATVAYSLYVVCRETDKRVWMFIVTLAGFMPVALLVADIVAGGGRSAVARFAWPLYVGAGLSVSFLFATRLYSASTAQRWVFRVWMLAIVMAGIVTCLISSQADYWWNKGFRELPQIARIVNHANHAQRALVISDVGGANLGKILSLSYAVKPDVGLQMLPDATVAKHVQQIPTWIRRALDLPAPTPVPDTGATGLVTALHRYRDVFVVDYSRSVVTTVQKQGIGVVVSCPTERLWRVTREPAGMDPAASCEAE
jgi:uncharacterized membrane protein